MIGKRLIVGLLAALLVVSVIGASGVPASVLAAGSSDGDDSRTTATAIDVGQTANGTIEPDDVDWYAVEIEKGEGIVGNLTLTSEGTENLRFDIFTPDGEKIGEHPNDGMGAAYVTNRLISGPTAIGGDVAEQSGTYYVRVKNVAETPSEATDYELSLDTVAIDRYDPNEQPATAPDITLGESVSGTLTGYDRDVYAVDLRKGETVTVDFTEEDGAAFPWLYVFNPALPNTMPTDFTQYEIATVGTFNETTTFTANETGTYYFSVVPFYDASTLSTFQMNPRYEFTVSADGQNDETGSSGDEPTETDASTETTLQTLTDPRSQTNTSPQTTPTLTHSNSTEAATTTASAERTPPAENSTATDGPGFGVLSALAAVGVGLWRSRRRE